MNSHLGAMAERPVISVIIPAHDAAAHLRFCLDALRASDLPRDRWELIVVDDASTDSTPAIAAGAADQLLRTGDTPRGPACARNTGAEAARGDLLAFIDADVAVHRDALRRLADRLHADEGLVAVFGSYDETSHEQSLVSRYRNLLHHYAHQESAGEVATFWAGCGAVRASAFRDAGGFDESRYPAPQIEDIELGYRLRRVGRILLDPAIQATHYKRWSVWSMIRTDFRDRAVPWVRLLLASDSAPRSSAPSLSWRAMLGTTAAGASVACAVLAAAGIGAVAWALAGVLFLFSVLVNRTFYAWLGAHGGARLTLVAIPLHFVHQVLSAVAVPVGAALYLVTDTRGTRSQGADTAGNVVAGARLLPLALGETGARVIAFATTAYLARRLGAAGFGQIAFATALVAHFGTALAVGIGEVGARDVALRPERDARVASAGLTLRLLCAVVAVVAIIALSLVLPLDSLTRALTWLYALSMIPFALDTGWVYRGLGRTGKVGLSLVISNALVLLLVLLFVDARSHVTRVPVIQIAGGMAAAAFLAIPLMRGRWRLPAPRAVSDMARSSRMITLSGVLRTIVVSFDVVLLGLMLPAAEVGLYSAAYRIVFFVMAIIHASHVVFLPEVARSATEPGALSEILSRAIGLAMTVTVPFVVGGILIAPSLMDLIFGTEYRSAAAALQLLLLALLFVGVHGATHNMFLVLRRPGLETVIVAVSVVVNIALNVLLIPRQGIVGSAIATLAGDAVILIGAFVVLARMGIRPGLKESLPAAFSGLMLAAALLAFGTGRSPIQSVLLGGLVYTVSIVALTLASRRRGVALVPEAR